jgi:hypothetical protein
VSEHHISIIEARERLHAQLWVGECGLDSDIRLAISAHRVWRALERQLFRIEEEGRSLSPRDLTEALRRRLLSTVALTVDANEFSKWTDDIVPLTSPPLTPDITAVEATSFLAYGAFLSTDDITAAWAAAIEISGSVRSASVKGTIGWERGKRRLFGAHVDGLLTLYGRKAPRIGAAGEGDVVGVPKEFLAGDVTLGVSSDIYNRGHVDQAMYCRVVVSTAEFSNTFLVSKEPTLPTSKITRQKTRAPTNIDKHGFRDWAGDLYESRGYGPSREEAEKFATERRIARDWGRDRIVELPDELRRERGGKGSTKYKSKLRGTGKRD